MKKPEEALKWIIKILKKHKIPYRISGGLAAKIYGSNRPLADIDIEVRDKDIKRLYIFTKDCVVEESKRYKDKKWDVVILALNYKGQRIELCGIDTQKIFDNRKGKWVSFSFNHIKKEVFGINVRVIPLKELIEYKSILNRRVDREDLDLLGGIHDTS